LGGSFVSWTETEKSTTELHTTFDYMD